MNEKELKFVEKYHMTPAELVDALSDAINAMDETGADSVEMVAEFLGTFADDYNLLDD